MANKRFVGFSSVLDMLQAYRQASQKEIPYRIAPRRPGDIAEMVADTSLAREFFGFQSEFPLDDMCHSSWRWVTRNSV